MDSKGISGSKSNPKPDPGKIVTFDLRSTQHGKTAKRLFHSLTTRPQPLMYAAVAGSYTHTHTHTHVGFYGLRGLFIGVMVFILYKLYVLLPYTYPTPKPSPHRRLCISTFPPQNLLCMIYKHFELWGH